MKRWPIIRHIRWLHLAWRLERWMGIWRQYYAVPSERDIAYLDDVWRGKA